MIDQKVQQALGSLTYNNLMLANQLDEFTSQVAALYKILDAAIAGNLISDSLKNELLTGCYGVWARGQADKGTGK